MKKRSLLHSIVTLKCPRCRKGPLFLNQNPYALKQVGKMPETCPNCGQDYVIEPGFYFGASMVSYILQMIVIALLALGLYLAGVRTANAYIFSIGGVILLSSPYVLCLSRAIWLAIFMNKPE